MYLQDRRHVVVGVVVVVVVVVVKRVKLRYVFVPHLPLSGNIPSVLSINLSCWVILLTPGFPAYSILPHYKYNNNYYTKYYPVLPQAK